MATLDDLPGVAEVATATGQSADGSGADPRYAGLLLMHGRLIVASSEERVVGFTATVPIDVPGGPVDHLADLFVDPAWHGRGVGRELLDAAWSGASQRSTFSSSHPSALPLYVRAGMRPLWPLVYVEGPTGVLNLGPSGLDVVDVTVEEAADVERSWGGGDRTVAYSYFLARPAARVVLVRDGGTVLGVAGLREVRGDLAVSHLRVVEPDVSWAVLATVLRLGGARAHLAVPGPSAVLPTLLRAGWRVVDVDHYMATSGGLLDPTLLFPHPGLA